MINKVFERRSHGSAFLRGILLATGVVAGSSALMSSEAHARYTGTGAACVTGVASNDRLNVRTGPSSRTRIVGSFAPGQCGFDIISVQGSWTYLRGSDRGFQISGWVNNRFLRSRGGGGVGGYTTCVTGVASHDVLNIRSRRSARSRIVGGIPPFACGVRVGQVRGRWAAIHYNGISGWVARRFLEN